MKPNTWTLNWLPQLLREVADEGTPSAVTSAGEDTAPAAEDTTPPGDDTTTAPEDAPEPITMESISLPEGFEIPEDAQEEFLGLLNNPELSRAELVNQLIEKQAAMSLTNAEQLQEAIATQWTETQTAWQKELSAVPEFGGERLDESLAEVKKGLEAAGATKEVFDALDVTGAGNHPKLVPLLHKLIKPYLEGKPTPTNPAQGELSKAERMFPNMSKG